MREYRVSWEVDIIAASPLEAAQKARAMQQDPHNIATVFNAMAPCSCGCGVYYADQGTTVDLDDIDGTAETN